MVQEKPINQHLTPSVKKSKLSKSNVLFFTHQTDEKIKDGYDLGEHADGETSFSQNAGRGINWLSFCEACWPCTNILMYVNSDQGNSTFRN